MMRKFGLIFLSILLCGLFSTGCYDRIELDDMAYVVGIGIDKGRMHLFRITIQVAVPLKIANGGEAEESYSIQTIEAPTIYSGLNRLNTILKKQIDLSHAKVIVFSKELAQEGLDSAMNEMLNGREFRPSMHVLVAQDTALEYLKMIKPKLEISPVKYHELNHQGYLYTGFSADTRLYDFYIKTKLPHIQAVTAISAEQSKGEEDDVQIMGLAVFKGTKMIGELCGEEVIYHLITLGDLGTAHIFIQEPLGKDDLVVLRLREHRRPKYNIDFHDDKPTIGLVVMLEGEIMTKDGYTLYEDIEELYRTKKKVEDHVKMGIVRYLNRTKELEADINGFGGLLRKDYSTWREWEKFNWLDRYKESTFHVEVSIEIKSNNW